jgi:hypothetical protein
MSTSVLSPFERLAPEILQRIAYHLGTYTFHGPPCHLLPLLCTSSTIYRAVSLKSTTHLYADIFRFKFDDEAPARRLSDRWLTTKCLAHELVNRCLVLKRIRNRHPHSVADLWTAYLMMLESDGRNESQLIDWAGVVEYLYTVISDRTNVPPTSQWSWFEEREGTALTIWLLFMTMERGKANQWYSYTNVLTLPMLSDGLSMESPERMQHIQNILFPFVVSGHRVSFHSLKGVSATTDYHPFPG